MLDVAERRGAFAAPVVPRRVQAGGAAQLEVATVLVARQAAPARGGVEVFIGQANAQGGVGAQVEIQGAVVGLVAALGVVVEVAPRLLGHHRPAAHGAGVVEGAAGVDLATVVVPGAATERQLGVGAALPALAHKVDRARGAARAFHHARCAAQHFHAVEVGHVAAEAVGLYVVVAHVQGHAVVLVLAEHLEAAGIEVFAAHGRVVDGDAGDFFHHLVDGGQVLVVKHLAGHDGEGLGRVLEAVGALADGHRARGVGAAVLGGGPQLLGGNGGGPQFQGRAVGRHRPQHVAAVALRLGLQAAALQDAGKTFGNAVGAPQPGRAAAFGVAGVE